MPTVSLEDELHYITNQITNACSVGLYSVAITQALAMPSICGALESDDGRDTGAKYKAWVNSWLSPKFAPDGRETFLSGEQAYGMRCGIIHQGTADHRDTGFSRIILVVPGQQTNYVNCVEENENHRLYWCDITRFCELVIEAVNEWKNTAKGTENYVRNFPKLLARRTVHFSDGSSIEALTAR